MVERPEKKIRPIITTVTTFYVVRYPHHIVVVLLFTLYRSRFLFEFIISNRVSHVSAYLVLQTRSTRSYLGVGKNREMHGTFHPIINIP